MSVCVSHARPFSLDKAFDGVMQRAGLGWMQGPAERALAFPGLNEIYSRALEQPGERSFFDRALQAMNVAIDVDDADLTRIPRAGPLVVVANHPFGGVDGLIMPALLRRIRPDFKLLANHLLAVIPEMREASFLVDPFDRVDSAKRNLASLRAAIRWVKSGGALCVFPSGEVSHSTLLRPGVADPAWSKTVAKLIRIAGAAVTPLYFEGRNSVSFQLAGFIHPRLRTALLPRELLQRAGRSVRVHIGSAIPKTRLQRFDSDADLIDYLRLRTYMLNERSVKSSDAAASINLLQHEQDEIAPPMSRELVAQEIDGLPMSQCLIESGAFTVFQARAGQIPSAMQEIGRLREIAFREVGEGTGKRRDIDWFDEHYIQLILWNRQRREIAGGYRLGPTDEILDRCGPGGLYTSTLFDYRKRLLEQVNPALELGRSFVSREYQKSYAPLLMLWKGIGRFAAANPRYRLLFGPVSISNQYRSMSKQLLISFLKSNRFLSTLSELIRPKHPPRFRPVPFGDARLISAAVTDIDDVDDLVREIETDRKSIPVLLRQYLKLNAMPLAFNVDPDFGDVLDGLMLVDLTKVDRRLLEHYMGETNAETFLAHHRSAASPA